MTTNGCVWAKLEVELWDFSENFSQLSSVKLINGSQRNSRGGLFMRNFRYYAAQHPLACFWWRKIQRKTHTQTFFHSLFSSLSVSLSFIAHRKKLEISESFNFLVASCTISKIHFINPIKMHSSFSLIFHFSHIERFPFSLSHTHFLSAFFSFFFFLELSTTLKTLDANFFIELKMDLFLTRNFRTFSRYARHITLRLAAFEA